MSLKAVTEVEPSPNPPNPAFTRCEAIGRAWKHLKSGISNNKGKIAFLFLVAAIAIPLAVTYNMPATRSAMHHFSHQVNQLYKNHFLVWVATGAVVVILIYGAAKLLKRYDQANQHKPQL